MKTQPLLAPQLRQLLLAASIASTAVAQGPGRITITRDPVSEGVKLSWTAIPGITYDLLTSDGVGQPWVLTNLPAKRATTTVATVADLSGPTNVPTRFYRVRQRAVPPGNTAAITATTAAEVQKMLGLTFSPSVFSELAGVMSDHRATYEAMRQTRLLNSDPPALIFSSVPVGFTMDATQKPISWSAPQNVTLPTNRADLAFYTVRDLSELIRTRQLSSTELTQLYLERLKKYDPILHCVITLTEELALRQAARADEEIAAGLYRGPLHGIPYGIKDLFSVRGYPTTWGAAPFRDQTIDTDATVAQKLEQAGAVLLAKLSTGELAYMDVWFRGQTRNPWSPTQGSGGSSAGSASATAAGLVAFSIGTETFGSIWLPCTTCRATGLRSTFGRVSRTGGMSSCWSMDKIGPICRSVEDCALVFEAIRGPDGVDESVKSAPFNYEASRDLKSLRVGYVKGYLNSAILQRLADLVGSSQLTEITLPSYAVHPSLIIDAEAAAVFDELTRFGADNFLAGTFWPAEFRSGRTIPAVEYLQAQRLRYKLVQQMWELMKQVDVYVTMDGDSATLEITNLTGQPCVFIPHGSGTSMSIIGKPFDEATILALAKAYQDTTTYHTNRPPAFIQ